MSEEYLQISVTQLQTITEAIAIAERIKFLSLLLSGKPLTLEQMAKMVSK